MMTRKDMMRRPSAQKSAAELAMNRAKRAEERAAADFGVWSPEHKAARDAYEAARAVHLAQYVAAVL
jgi:hypothetical protein